MILFDFGQTVNGTCPFIRRLVIRLDMTINRLNAGDIRPEFLTAIQSRAGRVDAGAVAGGTLSLGTSDVGDLSTLASQAAGLGDSLLRGAPGSMAEAGVQEQLNRQVLATRAQDPKAAHAWDFLKDVSNRAAQYPGRWFVTDYRPDPGMQGEWNVADSGPPRNGVFSVDLKAADQGAHAFPLATVFIDTQAKGGVQAYMLRYPAQFMQLKPLHPGQASVN
jgi:hypothetical protein